MKRVLVLMVLLLVACLGAVACAQSYSFSRLDTVLVRWDPAAETNISFYQLHFTDLADTNRVVTSKVASWDVLTEPNKWQTKYNMVLPVGNYMLRMTATNTSNLTSLYSDPITIVVTDPAPLKPRGIILMIKRYADK